jgi:hypothetical protein
MGESAEQMNKQLVKQLKMRASGMTKTKATHIGTCQGCGHRQKLPNGRLSLHGYSVKWNCFVGRCAACYELPYELSCDFIKHCIELAERNIVDYTARRDVLLQPATEPKAYVQADRFGNGKRSWQECEIRETFRKVYTYENGKTQTSLSYGYVLKGYGDQPEKVKQLNYNFSNTPQSVLDCATDQNRRYARTFTEQIKQLHEYIQWQTERVANWKPKKLTPIPKERVLPPEEVAAKKAKRQNRRRWR